MKRTPSRSPRLQIADEDEDDTETSDNPIDPLSALVLQSAHVDLAKLPSVKPADSLALVPRNLESSQNILFLKVETPSVVTLKQVVDKRGDRFHITPHREAIIVECPSGGHFVEEDRNGREVVKYKERLPTLTKCVGEEDLVNFQARGVGALRVSWKKKGKDSVETGVIEGIEDELEPVEQLALVRRDKAAKSHTVPLRVVHDRTGKFTVSLTSVTDSLHNVYSPSDSASSREFEILAQSSVRFICPSPVQLLVNQTSAIEVEVVGSLDYPVGVDIQFTRSDGVIATETVRMTKRVQSIPISEAGVYSISEVSAPCPGTVLEPSTCRVELVPPPTMDMSVTTLHEWWVLCQVNIADRIVQWM